MFDNYYSINIRTLNTLSECVVNHNRKNNSLVHFLALALIEGKSSVMTVHKEL